jgi:hypothetical protein
MPPNKDNGFKKRKRNLHPNKDNECKKRKRNLHPKKDNKCNKRKRNLHQISAAANEHRPSTRPQDGQPTCFRITGVPSHWDINELKQKLQTIDPDIDLAHVELSVFRACSNLQANIALLRMKRNTTYFEGWKHSDEKGATFREHGRDVGLYFDKHFYGLTPLNSPKEPITAEFVPLQSSTIVSGH